jgi:HPt (histidine-containing phosphotransfer) domain-containing protein
MTMPGRAAAAGDAAAGATFGVLAELVDAIGAEAVIEAAELFQGSLCDGVARIRAALSDGVLAEAGRQAHSLKSSAALLGAEALSAALAAIERAALQGDRATAVAAAEGLEALAETSLARIEAALAGLA